MHTDRRHGTPAPAAGHHRHMALTRLILDISTLARFSGTPVGMIRVEHELAQHALSARPDITLAIYDPRTDELRELNQSWQAAVAGLDAVIDVNTLDNRTRRPAWRNLLSPRYPVLMALQRLRLGDPAALRAVAEGLQRVLLGRPLGEVLPLEMVFGPPLSLSANDTVLCAGSGWLHQGTALLKLKRRTSFRLAVICYDLLPLTHPDCFPPAELPRFAAYWQAVLPAAARVLCNAQRIARDISDYAAVQNLPITAPMVVPLGYTPARAEASSALPAPLQPNRFALFVSTIEPRKGHAHLLRVWRRLLAAGIPQQAGFHLVFVGRAGWMVEPVLHELDDADGSLQGSVIHLKNMPDSTLERLYQDAAFCVYPSLYEGFGLPIIEAFAHGKPVIASTGGALPETVAGLSPCLDPLDEDAWTKLLADWISQPHSWAPWAAKIADGFHYQSWPAAAEAIFEAAIT